jgi:Tol biopolymer transport system component
LFALDDFFHVEFRAAVAAGEMGRESTAMNTEQWETAWRILSAARELPSGEQRPFVEAECKDPEVLRRVVEQLEAAGAAESAASNAAQVARAATQVGRYRVAQLLGRGGMGEVYAAQDVDLGRRVALKFPRAEGFGDPAAVRRFVREAKAASALNHPNILTIHEVIESSSGLAIAMELVEGQPLSQLRGSALALRELIGIGSQAARALAAAHAQGIVHRDIKPENLMVRPDGFVKVLDFGLARGFGTDKGSTLQSSQAGVPAGTLRYMSPEQLRDEPLTGASDVFSLGIVLYELAAGRHPFEAEYAWETAHAIHTRDPLPPFGANPDTAWVDELIVSMLSRDATLRPSADEVAAVLSRESSEPAKAKPQAVRQWYRKWMLWAVVGLGAAAAAWFLRDLLPPWKLKAVEFTRYPGDEDMPSLSPDGQSVAFTWDGPGQDNVDIYIRAIGSTSIERVTTSPLQDYSPAWSPDGTSIAFLRKPPNSGQADIFTIPARGGPEQKVAEISLNILDTTGSLAWTPDGNWLVAPSRETAQDPVGLFLISPTDGTRRRLTRPPPDQSDLAPAIAPDGRTLAFMRSHSESVHSIYLLPLTAAFLSAGEPQPLPSFPNLRVATPQWTPDGKALLFAANPREGMALWRTTVPAHGEAPPPPRREMYAARSFRIRVGPPSGAAHRLMYSTETQERNLWRVPLAMTGASPVPQRMGAPSENNSGAQISPDGSRIVFESMRTGSTEIWIANIDGTNQRALTSFGGPVTGSPAWSPDGRRIAFDSRAEGRPDIYVMPAEGGPPKRVTETLAEHFLPSWSRDGRWLYYCSSRSGTVEVWRGPDGGGAAEQLTRGGGWAPVESVDGAALYYQRRTPAGWSLRRLTFRTGEDGEVLPLLVERAFEPAHDGIYYVPVPTTDRRFTIQFHDLRTGVSRPVTPILRPMTRRLSLAADGSSLLYSQLDRWGQDLMLVENFR